MTFQIESDIPVPKAGRGGWRPNSGRKVAGTEAAESSASYVAARARLESSRADMTELDFKIQSGDLIERAAVRQGAATALAAVAQAMRSIPDNAERNLGVDPLMAQSIAHAIDDTLGALADELAKFAHG